MCVDFDKCGTFALAFNGAIPTCVSFYGGAYSGVVSALAAASSISSEAVENFSIGFSVGRRFSSDVRLAYRDGSKVHSGTVTTYGHIFADIGVFLPTDYLKFAGADLSEYISISARILFLIDLGDVDTVINSAITSIRAMTKDSVNSAINSMINSGPELRLTIDGVLTLNLEKMTNGAICDFSFTMSSATVLLTSGKGRSGLESGFYFRLTNNAMADMVNNLLGLIDHYSDILNDLGFGDLSVPSVDWSLDFL
jgi:hypothetical protein